MKRRKGMNPCYRLVTPTLLCCCRFLLTCCLLIPRLSPLFHTQAGAEGGSVEVSVLSEDVSTFLMFAPEEEYLGAKVTGFVPKVDGGLSALEMNGQVRYDMCCMCARTRVHTSRRRKTPSKKLLSLFSKRYLRIAEKKLFGRCHKLLSVVLRSIMRKAQQQYGVLFAHRRVSDLTTIYCCCSGMISKTQRRAPPP